MEKTMDVLREMNIGRVKEILAITLGIDVIRERNVEDLVEKIARIVANVLHGVMFVEVLHDGKVLFSSGEKSGVPFDFKIGGGYEMKVYLSDLDDETMELLEYLQTLVSSHVNLLREIDLDFLTGALTRRAGERRLLDLFRKGERFQLAFVDLDKLKEINDRFGHEAGDMYLSDFVSSSSEAETVIRWGGDEFVLIFKDGAEDSMKRIAQRFWGEFSYGIVDIPDEAKTIPEAMKIADERMYRMKKFKSCRRS